MILIECQHEDARWAPASGFLEAVLLSFLLLRPLECPECCQRWYAPVFWKWLRIHPLWLFNRLLVLAILAFCLALGYLLTR